MRQLSRQSVWWIIVLKGLMYSLVVSSVFLITSNLVGVRWFRDNNNIIAYPAVFTGVFCVLAMMFTIWRIGLKRLPFARLRELEVSILLGLSFFPVHRLFFTDIYEVSFFKGASYIISCFAVISSCAYAIKSMNLGSRLGENLNA